MSEKEARVERLFGPALLGAMLLAVTWSTSAVQAGSTPTCDGKTCTEQANCGSKCVCNTYDAVCLDNT